MEDLPLSNELGHPMSKLNKKVIFYAVGAVVILVLAYFLFFSAPNNFPAGTIINIKEGTSLRYTSKYLKDNHLIRSRALFETFVIAFGGEKYITPGDYLFEGKAPVFEVAWRISKGESHLAPIKVTIPEGFDVSDISKTFSLKLTNFNSDKFLTEATAKEGYLFPDTYFFLTTDNEEDVMESMSNNFEKKIAPILPQITSSGKTEKDIITMASIIEKESKGDIDRGFISGILWKRIALGVPLQVDADLNTYKTRGLPKNPICNPGIKAIEAAIYPKNSPYLNYIHDKECNIHYAKTFAEHLLNKQKYLR